MPLVMIDDFTGGITDIYTHEDDVKYAEEADNVVINENGKLEQRPGVGIYEDIIKQIPPGNQRIDGIYEFDETIFVKSSTRLYYWDWGNGDIAWTTLDASTGAHAFSDSSSASIVTWSVWRGHLFITPGPTTSKNTGCRTVKVFRNSSGVWTCYQAGLPRAQDGTTGGLVVTPAYTVGSASAAYYRWYWGFTHQYTAKVDGNNVTFKDYGTFELTEEGLYDPITAGNTMTLGTLTYTNGTGEKYPVSTMKVETFRTVGGGYVPKYSVTDNLAASVVDNVTDANLGADLYIGDTRNPVLSNDPAPPCYYAEVIDGRMVYFGCRDIDSNEFEYDRIMESKAGDLDSVPATNFTRIEGKCTGGGHVGPHPIAFTFGKTYRIEGHYDLYGNGYMRARLVSEAEGCVSADSIIREKDFLLFASDNGLCWTDGFAVRNLTEGHLRETYASIDAAYKRYIRGVFDRKNRRAYWKIDNDVIWIMDTRFISEGRAAITTASYSVDKHYWNSIGYSEENQTVLIGHTYGYVLGLNESSLVDVAVETSTDLDTQEDIPIIPKWKSVAIRDPKKKNSIWMTKVYMVFKNLSGNLSLFLYGEDDDTGTEYSLNQVRQRSVTGLHKVKRWWNRLYLRSLYKQFKVEKGRVNIYASDDYSTATITGTNVNPDSGGLPTGPNSLVGYYIYFDTDAYTTGYRITASSGASLTLASAPGNASGVKYEIRGAPKDEGFYLDSVTLDFEVIGECHPHFDRDTDVGGNT